jgi:hypothetical protein
MQFSLNINDQIGAFLLALRGLSSGTQENYLRPVIKLHDYYKRNPARLNEDEIKAFLLSPENQSLVLTAV